MHTVTVPDALALVLLLLLVFLGLLNWRPGPRGPREI